MYTRTHANSREDLEPENTGVTNYGIPYLFYKNMIVYFTRTCTRTYYEEMRGIHAFRL